MKLMPMLSVATCCIALILAACTSSQSINTEKLQMMLSSNTSRADEDKQRDTSRKPADVITFLEIGKGMTVIDVIAGGGYYSEVLAHAVGEYGKVYSQIPSFFGDRFEQPFKDKFETRLPQVEYWNKDVESLELPANSMDAAITALNLHDVYNRDPQAGQSFMNTIFQVLKPGGVFGVIDHAGSADGDNAANHRMLETDAIALAKKAGFVVEASSDLLRNSEDNTSASIRDVERGNTDRFLLKLRKPK